ncbi:M23 family metallopeptidase, partial [uncultured Desulfovibrio sp.]
MAGRDGAYGNSVEIDHGGGIATKYAHLQRATVKPGQWVRRGEVIGHVGMTGRTTGPHLHYEVRLNGVPVNPMRYILE